MNFASDESVRRRRKTLLLDFEESANGYPSLKLNGRHTVLENVDPECTLLEWLRSIGLCGTKLACGEGGCGACTVSIYTTDLVTGKAVHRSANACLISVCDVIGCEVTTIEGVKDCNSSVEKAANGCDSGRKESLHPIQRSLVDAHASQCGFCTPGFVMSAYTKWQGGKRTIRDIEEALDGNLCRCTGYRPIIQGMYNLVENSDEITPNGADQADSKRKEVLPGLPDVPVYVPGRHLGAKCDYYRPTQLNDLLILTKNVGNYRLSGGHSERRVEKFFGDNHTYPLAIISTSRVRGEMNSVLFDNSAGHATLGSAVSLTTIKDIITEADFCESDVLRGLVAMLGVFASEHIRNFATLGGNICTACSISDLNVIWVAAGATFKLARWEDDVVKYREVKADDFFVGYRTVDLAQGEVLISVNIPIDDQRFRVYKMSRRRQDDLAIVNCAVGATVDADGRVKNAKVAFGGLAPSTVRAREAEKALVGHHIGDAQSTRKVVSTVRKDFHLSTDVPGGMPRYRMALARSFLFKFCMDLPAGATDYEFSREAKRGVQYFQSTGEPIDPVGKPLPHTGAEKHVQGSADYVDDAPVAFNELFLDFVLSTQATGSVIWMDFSGCHRIEGFVGEITWKDLPGKATIGAIAQDEPLFAVREAGFDISHCGQILAMVAATSRYAARCAVRAVKVAYAPNPPKPIVSIEDAIEVNSFHDLLFVGKENYLRIHKVIDLDQGSSVAELMAYYESLPDDYAVVSGEFKMGGQEHMYLETQATRAIPYDGGTEVEVFSSTQDPHQTQMHIAEVLGVQYNRVAVRTKRLGGGFGGKQTRSCILAPYAALAAVKFNRPARFQLYRDVDLVNTGKRHPFLAKYKIAARKSDRKLVAADIMLYANAGYSLDLSQAVLDKALLHVTNACFIRNICVTGKLAKTNIESNTAFRGFGAPQAQAIAEVMYEHIGREMGLSHETLVASNFAASEGESNTTHYGQSLGEEVLSKATWDQLIADADFERRKRSIKEFNSNPSNEFLKKGIAAVPIRFGCPYAEPFLNQATVLITLQKDGSVQLCHNGVEMGQGVDAKVCQVVASELCIPFDAVYVSEANTARTGNGVPTAASSGTDLNASAAIDACRQLRKTIEPYRDSTIHDPQKQLAAAATKAWFDRRCLSAIGYYCVPLDKDTDWSKRDVNEFNATPYYYHTYGAACSEVEVDLLTGEARVLRVDIVHDVGKSINPAIDIGQIEGAFMQGYGLFCMEELVYDNQGRLITRSLGLYKIPSADDIPCDFRVSLYSRSTGPTTRGSKAVGEPPLFGAFSVYLAIKDALYYARQNSSYFSLTSPLTCERLRLAIAVPGVDEQDEFDSAEAKWHAFA